MADAGWRVSAIIPSYNRADLLPETLASILAQTAPVHEIVVVDDGSTDDTAAIVAGFGPQVRYIRIENSGAPVARNVGAAAAAGDWLWFCDSDDLWRPTYLERCRALAAAEPRLRFIFGDFELVMDGKWRGPSKFSTAPEGFWPSLQGRPTPGGRIIDRPPYRELLEFQPIFHSTIVVARDLFQDIGGYDRTFARTGSEDFEFTLRCASHAPIGMVDEPLVGIRRHPGNFSGNHLRALLGEVDILQHAKTNHPAAQGLRAEIDDQIRLRRSQALDEAFALDDNAAVLSVADSIGLSSLGPRQLLKVLLARIPADLRAPIVSAARIKNSLKAVAR